MSDLYSLNPGQIVLYGTSWCGDCLRSRTVLAHKGVQYLDVDIDHDPQAAAFVRSQNNGNQTVPTIVFPDGTILIEPTRSGLTQKLESMHPTA